MSAFVEGKSILRKNAEIIKIIVKSHRSVTFLCLYINFFVYWLISRDNEKYIVSAFVVIQPRFSQFLKVQAGLII